MSKQRHLRKRRALDEDEDGPGDEGAPEVRRDALEDLKLLQRTRRRGAGIDASRLVPSAADDDRDGDDNELLESQYVKAEGAAKSQLMDEEAHMARYVETELAKRLGKSVEERGGSLTKAQQAELELYSLPEGLQANVTQEVTLAGMMTAITEVEVGKDSKMRRIAETEAAKARMLAERTGGRDDDDGAGGAVRRGQFAMSFGKQTVRRYEGIDPEHLNERRRFITERTRDLKDIARERQKKRGGW
ncbi:telomere length and silencing protein 1 [Scenedesmus sp. PABB004]|nr:telomere length and silencing protein 1 [Scenedesmus sp. PABB004]